MTGVAAIAAWTSPVLVVAVVARVTAGGLEAPLFILAALAAPLLALLAGPPPLASRGGLALALGLVTIACVLGGGFRAVTDLGHVFGLETGATVGAATALVLGTTIASAPSRVAAAAVVLGAGALVAALFLVGVAVGVPPWVAWSRVASRGAFELGQRSAWTQGGAQFLEPITLSFTEPHRITTVTAAVFRVTEADRPTPVVREWRLAVGEALMLRPGDALSIPAGAQVRFETGKRVPGLPMSGVAWADRVGLPRARLLAWWLDLTVTLAGGALVVIPLVSPLTRPAALVAPLGVVGVILAATCWGVYAVDAAPELSIGAPASASLARLASSVADEPWRSRVIAAIVLALVALLVGSAAALRQRLTDLIGHDGGPLTRRGGAVGTAVWITVVAVAAVASVRIADGWSLLLLGAGLAAATRLGPLVATGTRPGSEHARANGAVVGAVLFVVLTAFARWPAASVGVVATLAPYSALVAVAGAWLVAILSRRTSQGRRETVAAARRR